MSRPPLIVDTSTGDRYLRVDDVLSYYRAERQPEITRIELVRRLAAIGWDFK